MGAGDDTGEPEDLRDRVVRERVVAMIDTSEADAHMLAVVRAAGRTEEIEVGALAQRLAAPEDVYDRLAAIEMCVAARWLARARPGGPVRLTPTGRLLQGLPPREVELVTAGLAAVQRLPEGVPTPRRDVDVGDEVLAMLAALSVVNIDASGEVELRAGSKAFRFDDLFGTGARPPSEPPGERPPDHEGAQPPREPSRTRDAPTLAETDAAAWALLGARDQLRKFHDAGWLDLSQKPRHILADLHRISAGKVRRDGTNVVLLGGVTLDEEGWRRALRVIAKERAVRPAPSGGSPG